MNLKHSEGNFWTKLRLFLGRIGPSFNFSLSLLASLLITLMALAVTYEVICRYVFNSPTLWSQELCQYFLLWTLLGGAGYTLVHERHVRVEILTTKLPLSYRKWLEVITNSLGLVFSVVLTLLGIKMVLETYLLGRVSLSILAVPMYLPQAALPICGIGLTLGFIQKVGKALADLFSKNQDA